MGERVLVLADGDPLLFGIGATLVRLLGEEAVRLLPAVSSLQQACARLALPWHKVICLSLHGRDDLGPLNAAAGKNAPLCVLTDARTTPDVLARHLLDRGVDWFDAHVFERMGAPDEAVHHLSMAAAAGRNFGPACTLILTPREASRRPCLGLNSEELAVERGLISKKPVRAAALALLRIAPRHVVWDIGAGSGAVALEAAVLAHEGRVVAVERSAGRAMSIQENRRRFGVAILDVRLGEAPECLPALPDPQRVFIGGGLSGICAARRAVELAQAYPHVYAAVGWHPENCAPYTEDSLDALRAWAREPKVVAIGEIGLDYYWEQNPPRELQQRVLRDQLALAQELDLPVIVHDREAHADSLAIVQEFPAVRGVFHCFSGSVEMARELLKRGWYLGFDGPVTYKNARKTVEVALECPLDRMLLETDSPYMAPVPVRGTRNDSRNVRYIAEKLAALRGLDTDELIRLTAENGKRLFGIG